MNWRVDILIGLTGAVLAGVVGPIINPNVNGYFLGGLVFGSACTLIWIWHALNMSARVLNFIRKSLSKRGV